MKINAVFHIFCVINLNFLSNIYDNVSSSLSNSLEQQQSKQKYHNWWQKCPAITKIQGPAKPSLRNLLMKKILKSLMQRCSGQTDSRNSTNIFWRPENHEFSFFFNSKKIKLKAIKIALISLKIKMFFNSFWIIWSAKKIDFKKQVLQQFEKRNQ